MITFFLILVALLMLAVLILAGASGLVVGFGWIILIAADIALGIWIFVKIIKGIFGKKGGK